MPKITAILHARNDAARLGRALESLRPCDQIIVVDHGSSDDTQKVARQHGATVLPEVPGVSPGAYLMDAKYDWLLCLKPCEALTEGLEATLFEWKDKEHDDARCFCVRIREEHGGDWKARGPETRLVDRTKINWTGEMPPNDAQAEVLAGDLLHFKDP